MWDNWDNWDTWDTWDMILGIGIIGIGIMQSDNGVVARSMG